MRNFTCATDRRLLVYWTRAYCQDADAQEKEEKDAGGAQRMELGIFTEDRATAERSSSGVVERRRVVTVPLCTVCIIKDGLPKICSYAGILPSLLSLHRLRLVVDNEFRLITMRHERLNLGWVKTLNRFFVPS